jgi:hypothetical protein
MNTNRKKVIIATFLCAMIGFVACSDKEDVATNDANYILKIKGKVVK